MTNPTVIAMIKSNRKLLIIVKSIEKEINSIFRRTFRILGMYHVKLFLCYSFVCVYVSVITCRYIKINDISVIEVQYQAIQVFILQYRNEKNEEDN